MAPAVSDIIMIANLQVAATTPAVWLCGPVERVLAMLCHVGSRVLTCYGVARGHYRYFALGFVLLSAVDTVAGWAHLTNSIGTISMWWIEFAILPFAFISWYATLWCIRHWPEKGPPLPAAEMALPFEQREAA
ncbi:MAG: YhfC family intramembrane metalloprotease [Candidatus Hydrogenedentes bacterium]|nr:YhfC family intramembrane metalloprotease [Candidatus Hydrogenedentota bacterium]